MPFEVDDEVLIVPHLRVAYHHVSDSEIHGAGLASEGCWRSTARCLDLFAAVQVSPSPGKLQPQVVAPHRAMESLGQAAVCYAMLHDIMPSTKRSKFRLFHLDELEHDTEINQGKISNAPVIFLAHQSERLRFLSEPTLLYS